MTFDEMFQKAKSVLDKASAKSVDDHLAVQINVTGDGEGIFYVEATAENDAPAVEPYDYVDNDVILTADSKELLTALEKADTAALQMEGAPEKIAAFRAILETLPKPKKAAPKAKAPAKKTAAATTKAADKPVTAAAATAKTEPEKKETVATAATTTAEKATAAKTTTAPRRGRPKKK